MKVIMLVVAAGVLACCSSQPPRAQLGYEQGDVEEAFYSKLLPSIQMLEDEYSLSYALIEDCAQQKWIGGDQDYRDDLTTVVVEAPQSKVVTQIIEKYLAECWMLSDVWVPSLDERLESLGLRYESPGDIELKHAALGIAVGTVPTHEVRLGYLMIGLNPDRPNQTAEDDLVHSIVSQAADPRWTDDEIDELSKLIVARESASTSWGAVVCFKPNQTYNLVQVGSSAFICDNGQ